MAPSADTRGNLNAMTSPLSSAAQQEMLSASPACSEKVGLASPGGRRGAAPDLVSGRLAGCSLWVGGARSPGRGRRGGCASFAMARFPSVPGDASVLNRQTGMPGDHWPWGDRIACIIERTPGQVGQKHWQAPEIERIVLNNADCRGPE